MTELERLKDELDDCRNAYAEEREQHAATREKLEQVKGVVSALFLEVERLRESLGLQSKLDINELG